MVETSSAVAISVFAFMVFILNENLRVNYVESPVDKDI